MKKLFALAISFAASMHLLAANTDELKLQIKSFPRVTKNDTQAGLKFEITTVEKDFKGEVFLHLAIDERMVKTQQLSIDLPVGKSIEISTDLLIHESLQAHQLQLWLDAKEGNNIPKSTSTSKVDFFVARNTVPQLPLIEEFTSSTCGPCASFNTTFDPFLSSIDANIPGGQAAAVKYQMNWPPPGDDPSFNSDGNSRRNSYGVNSIPLSYLNGVATSTFNQAVIDAASGQSPFNLTPYFYLSGDTIKATCTAESFTNMTEILRLYLALTEDFYTYTGGTTSQTTFHYVMRKMLPNYVGTVLTNINADTTFITNRNYKLTYGNVVPSSFNIWGTSAGFTLVTWIQNTSTKEVFQAAVANTPSAQFLNESSVTSGLQIYPNPAEEFFSLKLELNEPANVSYTLSDLSGKLVQQPVKQQLPAGKHLLQTSTADLQAGIYVCSVQANNQIYTQRVTVIK
jgi:hypothetical protein